MQKSYQFSRCLSLCLNFNVFKYELVQKMKSSIVSVIWCWLEPVRPIFLAILKVYLALTKFDHTWAIFYAFGQIFIIGDGQILKKIFGHLVALIGTNLLLPTAMLRAVWPDWAIYCTLGNNSKPLAAINLPKYPTFLGNFCKGVKIINFSSEIIFGQLL